jgi:hypothetical protein
MSKRNLIEEILAKKQREEFDIYWADHRLRDIKYSFEKMIEQDKEDKILLSLYNIGIAACIEIAVRSTVRELIDSGSPYIDRIEHFKNELRFDLDVTKALHDKKISFGDFVSHLLPINGVEHINSHLDTLLNSKLKIELAKVREFIEPPDELWLWGEDEFRKDNIGLEYETRKKESSLIINDVDCLMNDISKLFTARHITAHEASFESVTFDEFQRFLNSAECFVKALYEYVEQTLRPDAPRFPFGASILALQASGDVYGSMIDALGKLEQLFKDKSSEYTNEVLDKLIASQEAFENYYGKEEEFQLAIYGNGLANSLRFLEARIGIELNKPREKLLKKVFQELNFEE